MNFSSVGALRLDTKRISENAATEKTLISTKYCSSRNQIPRIYFIRRTKANQKKHRLWVAGVRSVLLELVAHR